MMVWVGVFLGLKIWGMLGDEGWEGEGLVSDGVL